MPDVLGHVGQELPRSTAISGKPLNHPRVGMRVVCFPRRSARLRPVPMRMDEPSSVVVVRIACMGVEERRLRKREQEGRHGAEMEERTHQYYDCTTENTRGMGPLGRAGSFCSCAPNLPSNGLPRYRWPFPVAGDCLFRGWRCDHGRSLSSCIRRAPLRAIGRPPGPVGSSLRSFSVHEIAPPSTRAGRERETILSVVKCRDFCRDALSKPVAKAESFRPMPPSLVPNKCFPSSNFDQSRSLLPSSCPWLLTEGL